jgi:two-component system chemotaxis response regulator CheY
MKSLVIDDDASCRNMFKLTLENFGDCDTVSLGFEGVNSYREALDKGEPYDLLVIDIILPDINGNEVLKMVRTEEDLRGITDFFRTKIILTTSLDDEENRKLAENLTEGQESYYVKSFANEGFFEKLVGLGLLAGQPNDAG